MVIVSSGWGFTSTMPYPWLRCFRNGWRLADSRGNWCNDWSPTIDFQTLRHASMVFSCLFYPFLVCWFCSEKTSKNLLRSQGFWCFLLMCLQWLWVSLVVLHLWLFDVVWYILFYVGQHECLSLWFLHCSWDPSPNSSCVFNLACSSRLSGTAWNPPMRSTYGQ